MVAVLLRLSTELKTGQNVVLQCVELKIRMVVYVHEKQKRLRKTHFENEQEGWQFLLELTCKSLIRLHLCKFTASFPIKTEHIF